MARPWTRKRCRSRKSRSTGTVAMTDAAINSAHIDYNTFANLSSSPPQPKSTITNILWRISMKAIMVMFDTLNRHMLPPYGCDWTHAPNFQRLNDRTVSFENSYVASMPCMPARGSYIPVAIIFCIAVGDHWSRLTTRCPKSSRKTVSTPISQPIISTISRTAEPPTINATTRGSFSADRKEICGRDRYATRRSRR